MKYDGIKSGVFIERTNRFIARAIIDNKEEFIHVKNTGRCKEILKEGVEIFVEESKNPARKTRYSLISVYKDKILVNMDSQVPNAVLGEAIADKKIHEFTDITYIKREVTFEKSRFDFYYQKGNKEGFIEVKGVTLENGGIAMFPDAPTIRGTKHLYELIKAKEDGYEANIVFLIQMRGTNIFIPNNTTDKEFAKALAEAERKGVNILVYDSVVAKNSISLGKKINYRLSMY